jgi:hypothetical protein
MREWIYIDDFLTTVLVGGEWSALHPGRFTPMDRRLGGPQSQSGRRGEKKKALTLPGIELDLSVFQSVASRYTDCAG